MANSPFQISAQIFLQNKVLNLKPVVDSIRNALGQIGNVNVKLNVPQSALNGINQLNRALAQVKANSIQAGAALQTVGSQTRNMGQGFQYASVSANGFNESMNHMQRRVVLWTSSYHIFLNTLRLIKTELSDFSRFQNSVQLGLAQNSNSPINSQGVLNQTRAIRASATKWGVSSQSLGEVSELLSSSGMESTKVGRLNETVAKIMKDVHSPKGSKEIADLVILMDKLGLSARSTEDTFSALTNISRSQAVEFNTLAVALEKGSASFKQYGGNINQVLAFQTALSESVRGGRPEEYATVTRNLLARAYNSPDAKQALKRAGVNPYDLTGKQLDPASLYEQIYQKTQHMSAEQRNELLEKLSGVRGSNLLQGLFSEVGHESFNKALATGGKSGGQLEETASTAMGTLDSRLGQLKGRLEQLTESASKSIIIGGVATGLDQLTNKLIDFGHIIVNLLPALTLGGAAYALKGGVVPGGAAMLGPQLPLSRRLGSFAGIADLGRQGMARLGPYGQIGIGMSMSMLSDHVENPYAKAGLNAGGVGLMTLGMTGNPLIAGLATAGTALYTFAQTTDKAERAFTNFSNKAELNTMRTYGFGSQQALSAYDEQSQAIWAERNRSLGTIKESESSFSGNAGRRIRAVFNWTSPERIGMNERDTVLNKYHTHLDEQAQTAIDNLKSVGQQFHTLAEAENNALVQQWKLRVGKESDDILQSLFKAIVEEVGTVRGSSLSGMINANNAQLLSAQLKTGLGPVVPNYALRLEGGLGSSTYAGGLRYAGINNSVLSSANSASQSLTKLLEGGVTGSLDNIKDEILKTVQNENAIVKESVSQHLLTITTLVKFKEEVANTTEFVHKLVSGGGIDKLAESAKHAAQTMDILHAKAIQDFGVLMGQRTAMQSAMVSRNMASVNASMFAYHLDPYHNPANLPNPMLSDRAIRANAGGLSVNQLENKINQAIAQYQYTKDDRWKTAVEQLTAQLHQLTDASQRLTTAELNLASLEQQKQSKLSLMEGLYSSNPQERFQFIRNLLTTQKVVAGGDLNAVGFMQQKIVVDMLKGPLAQLQVFGTGKSGREVLDNMLIKANPQLFKKGLAEENNLRGAMKDIVADSLKAQNVLYNTQIKLFDMTIGKLDENNTKFLAGLSTIFGLTGDAKKDRKIRGFAVGGLVGGDNVIGIQQGEFIVNRQQAHKHLPLLRNINSGSGVFTQCIFGQFELTQQELKRANYYRRHWRISPEAIANRQEHESQIRAFNIARMHEEGRAISHIPTINGRAYDNINGHIKFVDELNKTLQSVPHTFTHEHSHGEMTHRIIGESSLGSAIVDAIKDKIHELVNKRVSSVINPLTGSTEPF